MGAFLIPRKEEPMARAPDELIEKAKELYLSGMKLVEIASQLNKPEGTIRRWKNTYDWDNKKANVLGERFSERSEEEVSWIDIENEYVTDIRKKACTLEELAEKYNVPLKTIKEHCAKQQWVTKRTEYRLSTGQNAIKKSMEHDSDRIARLIRITDEAAAKAEQALGELETHVVKNKKKTKVIEYKDNCICR